MKMEIKSENMNSIAVQKVLVWYALNKHFNEFELILLCFLCH